jgi:hypothetical protein
MTWREGKLVEAAIHSINGGSTKVRYGSSTRDGKIAKGETYQWKP